MLTDNVNYGDIVRKDGTHYYTYSFGIDEWSRSAIMTDYDWPENSLYGQYESISEIDAFAKIDEQRTRLTHLFETAKSIAEKAHYGQVDKGGQPYIQHPLSVAQMVDNLEYKIVALLHDVLEDSDVSPEELAKLGFTHSIINSVLLLTKKDGVDYEEYLKQIKRDSRARYVKIADLKHNLNISRIPNPTDEDFKRLDKYKKSLAFLES
jgi:(p)ppGpp synthase/HD superfamily hydrolase